MNDRYALPLQEQEQILITELLKNGVQHSKAIKVARIIAARKVDETLADEEQQLVRAVCREWLKSRKRLDLINQVLEDVNQSHHQREKLP